MKLFYAPGSSSLLPHIVLYEAGLPFTAVKVNEHTKVVEGGGDYRQVNPLGYVPALVLDNGTLLTEGPAIVQYIADQVPVKNLAPSNGTILRTKLQAWLNFCSNLFVVSNWSSWVNFDLSPYTNVVSYRKRIAGRAAVRRAQEAEGLIPWPSSPP